MFANKNFRSLRLRWKSGFMDQSVTFWKQLFSFLSNAKTVSFVTLQPIDKLFSMKKSDLLRLVLKYRTKSSTLRQRNSFNHSWVTTSDPLKSDLLSLVLKYRNITPNLRRQDKETHSIIAGS